MSLDDKALRSLATLLDEEDPASLALVRRQILGVGAVIIPYLDELRAAATPEMAIRLDSVAGELRFQDLRRDFVRLSLARIPDLEDGAQVSQFVEWFPGVTAEQVRAVLEHAARSALAPA